MDKKKIKRIIAREGLIILGIIGVSLLIFLVSAIFPSYKLNAKISSKITYLDNGETVVKYSDGTKIRFERKPSQQDIEEAFNYAKTAKPNEQKRDYYAEEIEGKPAPQYQKQDIFDQVEPQYKAEKIKEGIGNIGSFILLLGYPVYLLVRFIIWAVRTLREK